MARPSLPTLAWKKSAVNAVANATPATMLDSIVTLVGASEWWIVASSATDPAADPVIYVEIRPRKGSDPNPPSAPGPAVLENQRIIIMGQGNGGAIPGSSMELEDINANDRKTPPTATDLVVLYSPEGGANALVNANSADPYGGPRALGYICCSGFFNGVADWNNWLIESNEILCIPMEDDADDEERGFIAGPMLIGASTAAADVDAHDRIYAIACTGNENSFGGSMWEAHVQFLGSQTANYSQELKKPSFYAFDPAATTQKVALEKFKRYNMANLEYQYSTSGAGTFVGFDVSHFVMAGVGQVTPIKFFGTLRQMRSIRAFTSRVLIQAGGTDVAIVWGASPTVTAAAIAFTDT